MINLRYHVVAFAAAFLAFGLGILAGTTVINSGLIASLKQNTNALKGDLDAVREEVAILQKQLAMWDDFGRVSEPGWLRGRLAGQPVVIVSDSGVRSDVVSKLIDALMLAGARRPTRLTLTDRWSPTAPSSVDRLARTLRISSSQAEEVVTEAAALIGARLAGSSSARADDMLTSLKAAGFLEIEDQPRSGPFPAAGAAIVVLSSGAREGVPARGDLFIPMLKVLSASRVTAAAEPMSADRTPTLVGLVRADREISGRVCTVDHIDTLVGRVSLVDCLRALGTGKPAAHYGVREGATAVAPGGPSP